MRPISGRSRLKRFAASLLAFGLLAGASAWAQAPVAHPLAAPDVEAWLDGLMPTALKTAQVPGAVVVVVKDGQVLFEKGYGYADEARRLPVDPRATLFRPGSTSKLFTWTAVMQLVEQGRIDLDADVNTYLDFHIPSRHGRPVTMRELMTHRAGFADTDKGLVAFGGAEPQLGPMLKRYVPPRIFDPGEGPGYSNYGAALAAYIVERISGQPFDAYIDDHILGPLDMAHSTFRQPLPAELQAGMSKGYQSADAPGAGFEIVGIPPAGALSATGDDMAHFMIAQLQLGRYGDRQILAPQTAQRMQTTITRAFPDLDGNALGFYEQNINGRRVVGHGGDTYYFHSNLSLFPDDGVGLYIAVNATGKDGLGEFLPQTVFEAFADRYFPAPPDSARVDLATAKAHAAMIAGDYISTRRSDSTFLALANLISPKTVTANPDGTISAAPAGVMARFVEARPFLWRQLGGHDRIEAVVRDGRVARWSSDDAAPILVYQRPGGLAGAQGPAIIAALALIGLTALSWPIIALVRMRYQARFPYWGRRAMAYRLLRLCAVLSLVAVGLWTLAIGEVSAPEGGDIDLLLHLAQLTAFAAWAGGLVAALWNLQQVFRIPSSVLSKIFAVLAAAAFAITLWIALSYHLIGLSGAY